MDIQAVIILAWFGVQPDGTKSASHIRTGSIETLVFEESDLTKEQSVFLEGITILAAA
jgi:hypothetical protein